jgi:hypothetical protein
LVLAVLCGGFWFAVLAAGGVFFGHPIGTYLLAAFKSEGHRENAQTVWQGTLLCDIGKKLESAQAVPSSWRAGPFPRVALLRQSPGLRPGLVFFAVVQVGSMPTMRGAAIKGRIGQLGSRCDPKPIETKGPGDIEHDPGGRT